MGDGPVTPRLQCEAPLYSTNDSPRLPPWTKPKTTVRVTSVLRAHTTNARTASETDRGLWYVVKTRGPTSSSSVYSRVLAFRGTMRCAWVNCCYDAVPSLTTLATMRCRTSLSSEALMSCVGLTLSFHDAHKLSRYFSLWRPLVLLTSIIPVTILKIVPSHDMPRESKLPFTDSFH